MKTSAVLVLSANRLVALANACSALSSLLSCSFEAVLPKRVPSLPTVLDVTDSLLLVLFFGNWRLASEEWDGDFDGPILLLVFSLELKTWREV